MGVIGKRAGSSDIRNKYESPLTRIQVSLAVFLFDCAITLRRKRCRAFWHVITAGRARRVEACVLLHVCLMAQTPGLSAGPPQGNSTPASVADPSGVVDVVFLDDAEVTESSGLAISRRREGFFWTHNDSGGASRLYAFGANGQKTGQINFSLVKAVDWEDMASFVDHGKPRLLVADCGDNQSIRESIVLYLMDEPDPRTSTSPTGAQVIEVTYPDGPKDCEAVAVDTKRRQVILIAKSVLPLAGIYVLPLPSRSAAATRMATTAQRVGTLPLSMVTAMDISDLSGDIHVVSYFQAFRFSCPRRDMPIADQLKQLPAARDLPRWKQIESIAIDSNEDVWVTSEGAKTPLGRLPKNVANP